MKGRTMKVTLYRKDEPIECDETYVSQVTSTPKDEVERALREKGVFETSKFIAYRNLEG
jgi:hypothetical protein